MTPNMMKFMAASPVVCRAYLSFRVALASGTLDARFREQIALAVAQINGSEYFLSQHTSAAEKMGLTEAEIAASRRASSDDAKKDAGLKLASDLVLMRGKINPDGPRHVRAAGYKDAEIVELVANVALEMLATYFDAVAGTEGDFPNLYTTLCF
jgi:AhpD family alkylhydroperoxidase